MLKKTTLWFSLLLCLSVVFMAGSAMADTSVSWLSPPDGSSYPTGTSVNLTGNASGSGMQGGTGLDLALVIDTSGSMAGAGITAAKNAAIALVNALPANTTQVTIIRFNSTAGVYQQLTNLTTDKTTLINAINNLGTGGNTAIGSGIAAATAELTSVRAIAGHAKMEVVLSDGYNNTGISPTAAATAAYAAGVTVNTVGVPGHDAALMQQIATNGHGIYTNVTNLADLEGLFAGTAGNLVGLDHVDITLPDGTVLHNVATDGLGNFILPDQILALGPNTFLATAYGTDGTSNNAYITLNGTNLDNPVPEPGTLLLSGMGLLGLALFRKRIMKK